MFSYLPLSFFRWYFYHSFLYIFRVPELLPQLKASFVSFFFFSWYIESISSLECKALFVVLISFVLCSIDMCSFLVHFKKELRLTYKGHYSCIILLMRFLLMCLVSRSFLVLLFSFLIFFFLSSLLTWWGQLLIFLGISLSSSFLTISGLGSSVSYIVFLLPFFSFKERHIFSISNSIRF